MMRYLPEGGYCMPNVVDCWLEAETAVGFRTFYSLHLRSLKKIKVIHGPADRLLGQISKTFLDRGRQHIRWHSVYAPDLMTGLVVPALETGWIAADVVRHIEVPRTLVVESVQAGHDMPLNPELDHLYLRIKRCLSGALAALSEYDLLMPAGPRLDELVREWVAEYLPEIRRHNGSGPQDWHGFGTPLTALGPDAELLSAEFSRLQRTIHLEGGSSLTHTQLVRRFGEQALMRGYKVRFYHDALESSRIDHLVIPALSLGITNATAPHQVAGGHHIARILAGTRTSLGIEDTEYWWGVFQKLYTQAWRLMQQVADLKRATAGEAVQDLSKLTAQCTA